MTRPECQLWVELGDRESVGEALTDEAHEFRRIHALGCDECAREAAIWQSLRVPESEAPPDASAIDALVSAAGRVPAQPRRWRPALVPAAGAALACAAAFALWFGSGRFSRVADRTGVTISLPRSSGPSPADRLPTDNNQRPSPAGLEASCSEPVTGVTLCVGPGSRLAHTSVERPDRTVELVRGRAVVSLTPQPAGTTFSIVTAAGKVTAVGTIFSVEVPADGAAVVRVLEGTVLVRAPATGNARALSAGRTLRLGNEDPTPLGAGDREEDLALLPPSARAHEASSTKSPNGMPSGSRAAFSRQGQMLEQAQSLRADGEFAKAADLYEKISGLNPKSPSGGAALVARGELLLSSLNDARGALRAFEAYLAHGGPLAQEASFGKARALRALRRTADERRAIEHFLATYPDAPQSRVLRRRLAELE
jgi:ferric-dicitrate binding protein FerR (iron transport regulator)